MCESESCYRLPKTMRIREGHGFTLVELLVVIAVIAILIAILMPALAKAKRQTMLVLCMNNLRQLGVGLEIYVTENNYTYPPPMAISGARIWDTSVGPHGTQPDRRPIFKEIAGGMPQKLMFCPIAGQGPVDLPGDPWSSYFVATSISYEVGYMMLILFEPTWFSWTNSGNPDINSDGVSDGPYEPGHAEAAILSDANWFHAPQCSQSPCGSAHSPGEWEPHFRDSNVLFGDGHVEIRSSLDYWATRLDSNLHLY